MSQIDFENTDLSELYEAAQDYLVDTYEHLGAEIFNEIMEIPLAVKRVEALEAICSGDTDELRRKAAWRFDPVDIKTFLLDKYYLNLKGQIYPRVLEEVVELNSGLYVEAVLTGAIGVAKTTIAIWTTAYQLYLLSCLRSPQDEYGLDRSSEIVLIFQSITKELAKGVDFDRFRTMIEASPYFREWFMFDRDLKSELRFPHRIIVKPVSGTEHAAIGQNVMGGIIDEMNFMAVTQQSKLATDGGTFDQALSLYNGISRRRKSRFLKKGALPGILCLVSSKRYPGQFTDRKMEEAKEDSSIFVYDKRTWDILPPDRFSGEWFRVFVGNEVTSPRVLDEDEELEPNLQHLIDYVPEEYRSEFENDMMNALRDILGVSTLASHPFLLNTEAVAGCFRKVHRSILSREKVDFKDTQLKIYPKRFYKPELPRWVHIDLGVTGDSAGVACGTVPQFVEILRTEDTVEVLPEIYMDFTLEVNPPKGGEILFYKIRALLYKLKEAGLNIKWVSLDTFQSVDTIQMLRQKGFQAGVRSVDVDTVPYDFTKTAIYDGRLNTHVHPHLLVELRSLEMDPKTEKVDHPANGSKDVADAVAGVTYGLTMRKEIWVQHGVSLRQVPETITDVMVKAKTASEVQE